MDEEVIPRIKFISKIQKGEKINVRHLSIQQDNLITKFIRSFIQTDTRANTSTFIYHSIKKGFEILNMHVTSNDPFDRALCKNLIVDLRNCRVGILNLKDTYVDDIMFCCKLDALLEDTEARLNDIETKYDYLASATLLSPSILSPSSPKHGNKTANCQSSGKKQ